MLRMEVTGDDFEHMRFALSPSFELDCRLRALSGVTDVRLPLTREPQLARTLDELRHDTDIDLVLALQSYRYGPDFVAPSPSRADQRIEDDLEVVRATPTEVVQAEIRTCLSHRTVPPPEHVLQRLRAPDAARRIADALQTAWDVLLGPDWPRLRAMCERDMIERGNQLRRVGWAAVLAGLHPQLRWLAGHLEFLQVGGDDLLLPSDGAGLLLVPSVFLWPRVAAHVSTSWPRTIMYPVRGVATLGESVPAADSAALGDLIGASRARLLGALTEPASTTQLARALGLSVGSVGDHLNVLRRAGLLERSRAGRSVLYRRTPLGEQLARSALDDR